MSTKTQLFGTHQSVHVKTFRSDEKNIVTGAIEVHVTEPFDGASAARLARGAGAGYGADLGFQGVTCIGTERVYDERNQLAIYTYLYEGFLPSQGDEGHFAVFEFDVTMREEPIETHPSFDYLAQTYNWDPIRKEFSRNIPKDKSSSGLAQANNASKRATNPMYGVTGYLVPGVTFRISFATTSIEDWIMAGIGTIVTPPGVNGFPSLGSIIGGRANWLKLAPKIRRRGNCVEISLEYMASGQRGWNPEIYGRAALNGELHPGSGGGGGGGSSEASAGAGIEGGANLE